MKTRYKTFQEFITQIKVVHRFNGGILITCNLKRYVIVRSGHALWNTIKTKKSFLVRLYITEVLKKKTLSDKIARIPAFELLGKRFSHNSDGHIITSSTEIVNTETGEMDEELLVVNITNPFRYDPFKMLKSKITL